MVDRSNANFRLPETRTVEVELGGGVKTFQTFQAGDEIPLDFAERIKITDDTYKPPKGTKKGSAKEEPAPSSNTNAPPPANAAGGNNS